VGSELARGSEPSESLGRGSCRFAFGARSRSTDRERGTSSAGLSTLDCVQPPSPWHALEFVVAPVLELDPRPCDQIYDGSRNEDISGLGMFTFWAVMDMLRAALCASGEHVTRSLCSLGWRVSNRQR
jgi:hypothetical protein